MTDYTKIRHSLSKKLKPERFEHTIGVMYTAASLAMRYQEDIDKAMTAGLLHDCGKYGSGKDQIKRCKEHGIALTESELEMPALVHAKLGAYYAEHKYGIKDTEVLNAIIYHTTGRPEMTMLEKILYIADYIEPNREEIPALADVRKAAFENIDDAVALSAYSTISYLERSGRPIDPMSIKTYEYYSHNTK